MTWVTQFIDGFDHYASGDIGAKWTALGTGTQAVSTTIFRNAGGALKLGGGAASAVFKSLTQVSNYCIGFGLYLSAIPASSAVNSGTGESILGLGEGFSFPTQGQVGLAVLSTGKLHAVRGNMAGAGFSSSPADLAAGTTVLSAATWYYVEIRVFIHPTAGQFEVRVNGTSEINLTGINTQNQSYNYASVLSLSGGEGGFTLVKYFDDLYVRSSTSSTAEAGGFLGDVKIKPYYPNADGTYSAMTCSSGSTHNTLVKETTPNTTDYVYSSTALTKDSYAFQDSSETGTIKVVQASAYAYKMDAGFRGIDVFCKSGATEDFATSVPLSTTPKYLSHVWEQDPHTASDWSQTNFNAAEFGVRISADI